MVDATFATPPWVQQLMTGWEPRERLGGAAWAERERVLSAEESPTPGRWRSIPWQVEILDALADPSLSWIVILKATQVGASELVRCAIGRWALLDPGDVLWVMTTEQAARRAMKKLQAMFRATPALRPLLSERKRDTTLLELVLTNGMRIVIGWAGSAQSLSSDPFRYVILDEVAKYSWSVQGEGSPVDLARDRTKAFGRRGKVVLLSSPKEEGDPITTAYRECADRREFAAPCPACGFVQPFEWERVRWPDGDPERASADPTNRVAAAERVEREQSAWLSCVAGGCTGKIQPGRAQWEPGARWVQEEPAEPSRRRAYHVPEAWHWETTLSDVAGKFLRATHPRSLQTFYTGTLGQPYQTASASIAASALEARAVHPRVVPAWATCVLSTADTQLRGWWFMARAWGKGGRSRLLDWGWVETEDDLLERALRQVFPVEGSGVREATVWRLAVDTGGGMKRAESDDPDGSRTKQVYALVRRTRGMVALKGEGDKAALAGAPHRLSKVDELDVHLVNRNYYADELARLVQATGPVLWEECVGADDPSYVRQMSSEHRVLETTEKGSKWLWKKKSAGAANHLWDCGRYQVWLADHVEVEWITTPTWKRQRARPMPSTTTRPDDDGWLSNDGWRYD